MLRTLAVAVLAGLLTVAGDGLHAQGKNPDDAGNAAGLEIKIEPAGPIKAGTAMRVVVTTRKRGYLVVLTVEPDGEVRQIYPHFHGGGLPFGANDETNALQPGRPMTIPNAANILGNFELFATRPGSNAVIALLSPVPVQLVGVSELPNTSRDATSAVQDVMAMAKQLRVAPRNSQAALTAPRWSAAAANFQVD